jgi:hypothetical protein
MGLCPDVQTNKIIFTHMYMTGITLQTWGGGKGWTVESRGDGEEVSWQVTRATKE